MVNAIAMHIFGLRISLTVYLNMFSKTFFSYLIVFLMVIITSGCKEKLDQEKMDEKSVELAKEELIFDSIKKENSSQGAITSDVELITEGALQSAISWESSDTDAIGLDGKVSRPIYSEGAKSVKLTAVITKGEAEDNKDFELTVLPNPQPDSVSVTAAKKKLIFDEFKNENTSIDEIKTDLALSGKGAYYTTISWKSGNESVIKNDGKVSRPAYLDGNASVILTADITKGGSTVRKTFLTTVLSIGGDDSEAVSTVKTNLTFDSIKKGNTSESAVTSELTLSTSGDYSTTISWASSDVSLIEVSSDNQNGTVKRPAYASGDGSVTLTATISRNSTSEQKTFSLTVTKLDQTDTEAVTSAKSNLVFDTIKNANTAESSIQTDLVLSTSGTDGTTINWASDSESVIATDGTVTRPAAASSDASVRLTATISKGSYSDVVFFDLTVLKQTS